MSGQLWCVTGTDTDVGKTIVTAALAVRLAATGGRVVVDKPTQTGVAAGGHGDVDEVARLAGVPTSEGVRLLAPMAPVAAAAREPVALPSLADHVARVRSLAASADHVLVEGAGGLLVELDGEGHTLADLAAAVGASVVMVCRSALGTLNHTALTLEALQRRGVPVAGLAIGSWPAEPDDIALDNRAHLTRLAVPLLGAVPAGAARLTVTAFRAGALTWLARLGAAGTPDGHWAGTVALGGRAPGRPTA